MEKRKKVTKYLSAEDGAVALTMINREATALFDFITVLRILTKWKTINDNKYQNHIENRKNIW